MPLIVDPPEGWRYGFPKPFTFHPSLPYLSAKKHMRELEQWFIREGYPRSLVERGYLKHSRYWPDRNSHEE